MRYSYLLFDLDGTLTESGEGIINSALYALKKNHMELPDEETMMKFVGPPLAESFEQYCGTTPEQAEKLIDDYREYFNERGWAENAVYDGIPEALQELLKEGRKLIVATSKPESASKKILSYFQLDKYFTLIAGASMDASRNKKGDIIAYALDYFPEIGSERQNVLMIGDRAADVIGAKEQGIPCVGVLYGYGTREELLEAGAASICPHTRDLPEVIAALEREPEVF